MLTKRGVETRLGDSWDMPAAVGDSEDPEILRKTYVFFCCKCKGWTAAHSYLSQRLLRAPAQQSCRRQKTHS